MRTMKAGRRVLANVVKLGLSKVAADVCTFLMFLVLARAYGPGGIGEYSFAMALTGFISLLCNFGFEAYSVREVARRPEFEARCFGTFTLVGAALCPLVWLATYALVAVAGFDRLRSNVVLVIGAYQILYFFSQIVLGRFKARDEMATVGLLEGGLRLLILGGTAGAVVAGASLEAVLLVFPLAVGAYLAVAGLILTRTHRPLEWRVNRPLLKRAWPSVWPLGVAMVLHTGYMKVDILMLGILRSETDVGVYAAAYRPVFGFWSLFAVMSHAAYPVFSRLFLTSHAELRRTFGVLLDYFALVAGLAALAMLCLADQVIPLFYGDRFEEAVPLFRLFSFLLLVTTINVVFDHFMQATNHEQFRMRGILLNIGINVGLNLYLVSRYGPMGALAATLASEIILLALVYTVMARKGLGVSLFHRIARLLLCVGAGYGVWAAGCRIVNTWVAAAVGLLVYTSLYALLRGIRARDLKMLAQWFRRNEG